MNNKEFKSEDGVRSKSRALAAIFSRAAVLIALLLFSACQKQEKDTNTPEGEKMVKLKIGDTVPGFEILDQNSKTVKLSDFAGKKVLVYFYPKAETPGCTAQACSVRDSAEPLKKAGIVALGISPDKPDVQKKFDEHHNLGFRLLSDPDHKTAQAYGVWGKSIFGITRSSFLIDEKGKIIGAWYAVSPTDTVPKALELLGK
ncbi:MAG: thioredoxin-dependent thiol peroxidase [Sedimentisphaerales bacterium]